MSLSPTIIDRINDKFVAIELHTDIMKTLIDRGHYTKVKLYIDRQKKCCEEGKSLIDILRKKNHIREKI